MKRKAAILLTTCMVATCFPIVGYGASFSDINNVPWPGAVTYINQVADLGLMVGDIDAKTGKSTFRAKDHVTYCETTQLAYTLLKKTGKLNTTSTDVVARWTQVMKGYNIPAWAYDCVSYALENNIISLTDASRFVTKKGTVVTNNYASRESVAVIFGKFLSHIYTIDNNATLTFNDKASIATTSVPYVELLARLKLMVGDTNGNFTPKAAINRAEMAVLVSKTYEELNGNGTNASTANTISGIVTSLEQNGSNKLLAITTEKGDKQGFIVDNTTIVYEGDTTKTIGISTLEIGDGVSVEYNGSKANVVRLTNDISPSSTEVKGSIEDMTASKVTLLKSDDKTENFYFASSFDITLDGKTVSQKELLDTFDDYLLDATLLLDGNGNISKVEAKKGKESGYTGILVSISEDELSVKESKNSKTKDYEWVSNPEVLLEGRDSTISKVRRQWEDNDLYVKYYLDSSDRVKRVFVSEDEFGEGDSKSSVTGTIYSIDDDEVTIRKKNSKTKEDFEYASKIKFYLDGESCEYRDISKAYNKEEDKDDPRDFYIKVILDDDGDVKELYASLREETLESKEDYASIDGRVNRMDEDEIRVKEDKGSAKDYEMARGVKYYLQTEEGKESKESTFDKVNDAYNKAERNGDDFFVTLYLNDDDEVVRVEASTVRDSYGRESKGTVTKLSNSSITLRDKGSWDLDESDIKMYLNDSKVSKLATLRDLVDDRDVTLTATLTIQSGEVTKIEAYYKEVSGELLSVDRKILEVKTDDDNNIDDIEITRESDVKMSGDYTTFRDMTYDLDKEDIFVTLTCNEEGKVEAIKATKE